jgi:hypothetical protein
MANEQTNNQKIVLAEPREVTARPAGTSVVLTIPKDWLRTLPDLKHTTENPLKFDAHVEKDPTTGDVYIIHKKQKVQPCEKKL